MNPIIGGISSAMIEGAKDLIALIKYLGDKELKEKQLSLEDQWHQQQYDLQKMQIEKLNEYRNELLKLNRDKFEAEKNLNQIKQKLYNLQIANQNLERQIKEKELQHTDDIWESKKKTIELQNNKLNLEIQRLKLEYLKSLASLPALDLKNATTQAETLRKWANFFKDSANKTLQLIAKTIKPDKPDIIVGGDEIDTKTLYQYIKDFLVREDVDVKIKNKIKGLYQQYLKEIEYNQMFEQLFKNIADETAIKIFNDQHGVEQTNNPFINRILQEGEQ